MTLREKLRDEQTGVAADYDYILIDCPPSLGLLTVNALTAADYLLIPTMAETFAASGITQLYDYIESKAQTKGGARVRVQPVRQTAAAPTASKKKPSTVQVTVRLRPDQHKQLKAAAFRRDCDMSELVRQALEQFFM